MSEFEHGDRAGDPRLATVVGPLLATGVAGDRLAARADGDPDD